MKYKEYRHKRQHIFDTEQNLNDRYLKMKHLDTLWEAQKELNKMHKFLKEVRQ